MRNYITCSKRGASIPIEKITSESKKKVQKKPANEEDGLFAKLQKFCLHSCPHPDEPCGQIPCKEYKEYSKKLRGNKDVKREIYF